MAEEAGLSKGGVMYRFSSKEQLVQGVIEHGTRTWDDAMQQALGKPFEDATPSERVAAYAHVVGTRSPSIGELALVVDSVHDENMLRSWRALLAKWVGPPPAELTAHALDRAVARLAADGLWLAEATGTTGFDETARGAIVARIEQLARGGQNR